MEMERVDGIWMCQTQNLLQSIFILPRSSHVYHIMFTLYHHWFSKVVSICNFKKRQKKVYWVNQRSTLIDAVDPKSKVSIHYLPLSLILKFLTLSTSAAPNCLLSGYSRSLSLGIKAPDYNVLSGHHCWNYTFKHTLMEATEFQKKKKKKTFTNHALRQKHSFIIRPFLLAGK